MTTKSKSRSSACLRSEADGSGTITLGYAGRLDSASVGSLWRQTANILKHAKPSRVIVLGEEIEYCDGSGVAVFSAAQGAQTRLYGGI